METVQEKIQQRAPFLSNQQVMDASMASYGH